MDFEIANIVIIVFFLLSIVRAYMSGLITTFLSILIQIGALIVVFTVSHRFINIPIVSTLVDDNNLTRPILAVATYFIISFVGLGIVRLIKLAFIPSSLGTFSSHTIASILAIFRSTVTLVFLCMMAGFINKDVLAEYWSDAFGLRVIGALTI